MLKPKYEPTLTFSIEKDLQGGAAPGQGMQRQPGQGLGGYVSFPAG